MSKNLSPVITIDGPGGSGKGTVGQRLAWKFGWEFLDSGALYRLVGLSALKRDVKLDSVREIANIARNLAAQFAVKEGDEGTEGIILLDDQDVSAKLRTEECASAASEVAQYDDVRAALLERHSALAIRHTLGQSHNYHASLALHLT